MKVQYNKWVSCWGNATSIREQIECRYAKDITLRYPVRIFFSGDALKFHFSNLTGTEPVRLAKVYVAKATGDKTIDCESICPVLFEKQESVIIYPETEVVSDEVRMDVTAGETVSVNIYLEDCTQMNAGVLITGPLSKGFYSYGNCATKDELPLEATRGTNWFYFLNTVDIRTESKNRALICYGDSITAQSWPDYLALKAWEEGWHDTAIIRRAISGTRILREYDCITYAAYGRKGERRFAGEIQVAGADTVLIQHGINDIIHPVGEEVNVFRPWSDMPTVQELVEGFENIYIKKAREEKLKVYGGTLLPIYGWRTYTDFRDEIRKEFNEWLLTTKLLDGCVDFDKAVRNPEFTSAFADGFDSGDHLHPSESAYKAMADCAFRVLSR